MFNLIAKISFTAGVIGCIGYLCYNYYKELKEKTAEDEKDLQRTSTQDYDCDRNACDEELIETRHDHQEQDNDCDRNASDEELIETRHDDHEQDEQDYDYNRKTCEDRMIEARRYHYDQNYDRAIELYTEIIQEEGWSSAYNNRALCHRLTGNYRKAIEDADKALALDIKYAQILLIKGNCLTALGEPQEALKTFSQATEIYGLDGFKLQPSINKAIKVIELLKDIEDHLTKNDPKMAKKAIKTYLRLAPGSSDMQEKLAMLQEGT